MGLMGNVIGGMIGFAFGGPLGAILGAVVGGSVGERMENPMNNQQQAQTVYFVTTFSMLGKMAQADGKIDEREVALVERLFESKLGLDTATKQFAMRIFHQAAQSSHRFEDLAEQFFHTFQAQPQLLRSMLDLLMSMAMADGVMSDEEDMLLNTAARIFRIERRQYEHVKEQYSGSIDRYYAVLDCEPTASNDEIKKKYRKLAREFHPDMIISKGLPEEFTKFAQEKFQEIQTAYEKIKAARNF